MRRTSRRPLARAAFVALLAAAAVTQGGIAHAAPGDYRVRPDETAKHENGTPRAYRAGGLGRDRVDVALFACDRINRESTDPKFRARRGRADQGSPDARISEVNGRQEPGSPDYVARVRPDDGRIKLDIVGQGGCVQPVVFDDDGNRALDVDRRSRPTEPFGIGGKTRFVKVGVSGATADRCDVIDPALCLLPWPNDHFTRRSGETSTGKRLDLARQSMPKNRFGVPIEPSDYNRLDGFSPGQPIVTKVPGLETQKAFRKTGAVPITEVERSFDPAQPVVVINARTKERQLIWSEIDANPADPRDVNLIIRPAENLEEGERYIVALRDLKDENGRALKSPKAFRIYRDPIITSDPELEDRRSEMEDIFKKLGDAGIDRKGLYRAWDFTVASRRSLSERILSMRDDAFGELGDNNLSDLQVRGREPVSTPTSVTNFDPCGDDGCDESPPPGQNPESDTLVRRVEGQLVVPCYLDKPGCPTTSEFNLNAQGLPRQNPVPAAANYICNIPRSAVDGQGLDPARPSLYGHGLLGSADEVSAGNVQAMGNEHNFVFCATDWAGFATQDIPTIAAILQDLSNFPKLVDRSQQGFLNFMYLGRLMVHPDGFADDPAFQFGGESVIDTDRLFYDGNSQGGILGGSLTAVAPDFDRAVLGVPGMNYSTLLRRSVDFDTYAEAPGVGLYANYPNELERPLILSILQTYWDRGEANGYAHHMTDDPLPDTPPHEVLMHVAFGDHQVANVSAEVEARTIGARVRQPALDPGRHTDKDPFFGIPAIDDFPYSGSALVYWDTGPVRNGGSDGTPPPPTTNTPPREGNDPHGAPRGEESAREQKSEFLRIDGKVVDVCGDDPCYADGYTGPSDP